MRELAPTDLERVTGGQILPGERNWSELPSFREVITGAVRAYRSWQERSRGIIREF